MTRLLLFSFSLVLCLPLAAEPTIHVLMLKSGDSENMERLFQENVPKETLKPIWVAADEAMPDAILDAIRQIELTEQDTLFFYLSARTDSSAGNAGQYFYWTDNDGKTVQLQRRTLLAALMEKKARLTVLWTDICRPEPKPVDAIKDTSKKKPNIIEFPQKMSPVFEALFVKPTGTADLNSSKQGEASFATTPNGDSCFTQAIILLLDEQRDNASLLWSDFVAEVKICVQEFFCENYPNGYKFDPPLNGIVVQNTQTIEIYGTLPKIPKGFTAPYDEQAAPNKGPRFGVRAIIRPGGGVRVTDVIAASPGAKAGITIGDVILEINGKPLRSEQDYGKAVDDSPKTMNAKIVNAGDGRTMYITFELGY